jgi:DNA recombination protein Rad52
MAFTEPQIRKLKAKIKPNHIKVRNKDGVSLSYIEGWHAIAEANRIFGHEGWDRRTLDLACLVAEVKNNSYHAAYRAKVRITVRAGDTFIVREGSGTGEANSNTLGQAHELALKGAETDATKRALATFGNPFGLSLYDRDCGAVCNFLASERGKGPWTLRSATGAFLKKYVAAEAFAEGLRAAMKGAPNIEELFAVWEHNVTTVRSIHRSLGPRDPKFAKSLVSHLKTCARAFVNSQSANGSPGGPAMAAGEPDPLDGQRGKIDKSALTFGEQKRYRSKEHLRFVASQPCLICGRTPSQAHHVRFAQPKGVGLKVSDEFTVPLCAVHHTENHATGDERSWWTKRDIDPLGVAAKLWAQSRHCPALRRTANHNRRAI